jgi:hypothetical protein
MLNYGKKRAQKAELQILSIGCYRHIGYPARYYSANSACADSQGLNGRMQAMKNS